MQLRKEHTSPGQVERYVGDKIIVDNSVPHIDFGAKAECVQLSIRGCQDTWHLWLLIE